MGSCVSADVTVPFTTNLALGVPYSTRGSIISQEKPRSVKHPEIKAFTNWRYLDDMRVSLLIEVKEEDKVACKSNFVGAIYEKVQEDLANPQIFWIYCWEKLAKNDNTED